MMEHEGAVWPALLELAVAGEAVLGEMQERV
jgi:hypothetical protein